MGFIAMVSESESELFLAIVIGITGIPELFDTSETDVYEGKVVSIPNNKRTLYI